MRMARLGARRPAVAGLLSLCVAVLLGAVSSPPAPDAGVFALSDRNAREGGSLVVIGKVRDVDERDDRVAVATVAVDDVVTGEAPRGTLRVTYRRLFAGDKPALVKGDRTLLFLEDLPLQTYWRKRFPEKSPPRYLADPAFRVVIAEADARAYRDAVRAFRAERAKGASGEAVADLLLRVARGGPPALGADAIRALAPELARVRGVGTARWGVVDAWLRAPDHDLTAKRAFTRDLGASRVYEAVDLLLGLERDLPALRVDAVTALGLLGTAPRPGEGREDIRRALLAHVDGWLADADAAVRRAAVPIVAAKGEPSGVERLGALGLTDPDDGVAIEAVDRLADLATDESTAYPPLGRIAREGRDGPALRAITALGRLGTEPAARELSRGFEGDRYRLQLATIVALANMNQPLARETIERVRKTHPNAKVRTAIERLLRNGHP